MPHALALAVEVATTVLTVAGMGYFLAALVAARVFVRERRRAMAAAVTPAAATPGVSVLKSLKGLDPGMLDAFRSHCTQSYKGEFELLFGISDPEEPAAAAVRMLQESFQTAQSGLSSARCGWERTAR